MRLQMGQMSVSRYLESWISHGGHLGSLRINSHDVEAVVEPDFLRVIVLPLRLRDRGKQLPWGTE